MRALNGPTIRSALLEPPSRPMLISVSPNDARSEATMMSDTPTRPKPAPMAAPSTAAMTGTGQCRITRWVSRQDQPESTASWTLVTARPDPSSSVTRSLMSTPAQNARSPSADSTTAPTSRSFAQGDKAVVQLPGHLPVDGVDGRPGQSHDGHRPLVDRA